MKISDNFAINVLMRREAILAVKRRLYNEGRKVSLVACKEIHTLAREYLAANEADLIAQAKRKWELINARTGNRMAPASPLRSASGA